MARNYARLFIPPEIRQRMAETMADHCDDEHDAKHGWSVYYSPTTRWPLTACILRYRSIEGRLYE